MDKMKWSTATKIYMSKYQKRNGKPLTRKDLFIASLLFFLLIPLIIIICPIKIYQVKKNGGITKRYRKNYLYYKNG